MYGGTFPGRYEYYAVAKQLSRYTRNGTHIIMLILKNSSIFKTVELLFTYYMDEVNRCANATS